MCTDIYEHPTMVDTISEMGNLKMGRVTLHEMQLILFPIQSNISREMSVCPYVCLSVCLCVCPILFRPPKEQSVTENFAKQSCQVYFKDDKKINQE